MIISKLYIGEIKGVVKVVNEKGSYYKMGRIKVTCLKRVDYNKFQDIFDKKIYDIRYKNGHYLDPYTMVKYSDVYPCKIKSKKRIKRDLNN